MDLAVNAVGSSAAIWGLDREFRKLCEIVVIDFFGFFGHDKFFNKKTVATAHGFYFWNVRRSHRNSLLETIENRKTNNQSKQV